MLCTLCALPHTLLPCSQELRGLNLAGNFELPEWKTKASGKGLAYGQTSSKSLKDQRESLPIYRLKAQVRPRHACMQEAKASNLHSKSRYHARYTNTCFCLDT